MLLRTTLPLLSRVRLDCNSTIVTIVRAQVVGLLKLSCTLKFPLETRGSMAGSVLLRVKVKSYTRKQFLCLKSLNVMEQPFLPWSMLVRWKSLKYWSLKEWIESSMASPSTSWLFKVTLTKSTQNGSPSFNFRENFKLLSENFPWRHSVSWSRIQSLLGYCPGAIEEKVAVLSPVLIAWVSIWVLVKNCLRTSFLSLLSSCRQSWSFSLMNGTNRWHLLNWKLILVLVSVSSADWNAYFGEFRSSSICTSTFLRIAGWGKKWSKVPRKKLAVSEYLNLPSKALWGLSSPLIVAGCFMTAPKQFLCFFILLVKKVSLSSSSSSLKKQRFSAQVLKSLSSLFNRRRFRL